MGSQRTVSLADARAKRDEVHAVLYEGRDPSVARKLAIEANIKAGRQTFERVAREWHANAKPQWARVHADDVLRSLHDNAPGARPQVVGTVTPIPLDGLGAGDRYGDVPMAGIRREGVQHLRYPPAAQAVFGPGSRDPDPARAQVIEAAGQPSAACGQLVGASDVEPQHRRPVQERPLGDAETKAGRAQCRSAPRRDLKEG